MDFVLVRINVCGQGDVVPFVSFDCIWVGDGPALAVLVAHKRLAVLANFACDPNRFLGGVRLPLSLKSDHPIADIPQNGRVKRNKQPGISSQWRMSAASEEPGRLDPL